MTDKFEILKKQYGSFLVKETGWPKLDPMCVRKSLSDAKIEQGLDPSKITILYAPTFSKRYTSSSDLINEIKILQNKGWQWIAKFHDLEQIEIIQEYKKLSSDQFNIVQDLDILPWMYAADILLTDTSSVAYEFLQLNRPIITYRAFARKGKGIDITNPENIYGALVRSIEDPNEFKTPRKEYLDDLHPYSDGKSSERVIKGIENILKSTELSQLKPKSMNWYRKRQIRKLVLK